MTPPSPVPEKEPDVDNQIQEIADELVRMAHRLPVRLSGEGPFLEMVARILKRENRMVNCLKCAVGLYDGLFDSVVTNIDAIIDPPAEVIETSFEHQSVPESPLGS